MLLKILLCLIYLKFSKSHANSKGETLILDFKINPLSKQCLNEDEGSMGGQVIIL